MQILCCLTATKRKKGHMASGWKQIGPAGSAWVRLLAKREAPVTLSLRRLTLTPVIQRLADGLGLVSQEDKGEQFQV